MLDMFAWNFGAIMSMLRNHSDKLLSIRDTFFRDGGASLRRDIMPATRPRELQFRFGLVDLVARDTLTRARSGERCPPVPGSYELLNCFVTVRPDFVATATSSLSSLSLLLLPLRRVRVSRDRFRNSPDLTPPITWTARFPGVRKIDREDCSVRAKIKFPVCLLRTSSRVLIERMYSYAIIHRELWWTFWDAFIFLIFLLSEIRD